MTYTVEIQRDGSAEEIEVAEDQPILESAEEAGLEIDHSCRTGSCTSCAARVLEGEVEQKQAMGLDPQQKQDGYALLCVAHPRSDLRIKAGVQDELFEIDF